MCFLIQGLATAFWDIGGNHIVLGVWEGVSSSPINAMHAGRNLSNYLKIKLKFIYYYLKAMD